MSAKLPVYKRNLLKKFLNDSTLHGLRLLLYYTPFKYARFLWKILIAAVIIWTQYVITNLIVEYMDQPTEVRMSTQRVHISESPFPAACVCNGNKFSRRKLDLYAQKVFKQQQLYHPNFLAHDPEEMATHLLLLDNFYIFPYDDSRINPQILDKLNKILSFMYNTTNYPVREILRLLAPNCDEMIIRGIVYGEPVNVSDYWLPRMTTTGVCCMFNYKRASFSMDPSIRARDNAFIKEGNSIPFESNSILNSVQFVMQSDVDDFTVTDFDVDAFIVTLFPPRDYTSIQSSHIGTILVEYNSIVEIPVQPEFYESSNKVRQFKPSIRNCYFPDEGQKLLNTPYYSLDECLMKCRSDSMIKYCGCVTPPMVATVENITYCTVMDIICLRQWKQVWYGWDYFDYVNEGNSAMLNSHTTGSRCPQCLPTCNGVKFRIFKNIMTLRPVIPPTNAYSHGLLKGLNNSKPLAIIKLFFKQRFAYSTTTDVVAGWVVHLNRFGGIMGLMYGFSIISCIEIVYFATGKFFCLYSSNWRFPLFHRASKKSTEFGTKSNTKNEQAPSSSYSLYWSELTLHKPKAKGPRKHSIQKEL